MPSIMIRDIEKLDMYVMGCEECGYNNWYPEYQNVYTSMEQAIKDGWFENHFMFLCPLCHRKAIHHEHKKFKSCMWE